VLGSNPLLWLWPQEMRGDGLSYPVNPDAGGESAVYDWAGVAGRQSGMDHGFGPEESVMRAGHDARGVISGVADDLTQMASGSMPTRGSGKDRFRLSRGETDSMV
jgi:palmitoyltransferase